jgi:enediyne biosynthesis protein E4
MLQQCICALGMGGLLVVMAAEPLPWKKAQGYRYFEVPAEGKGAGFTAMDGVSTGVQFTNVLSHRLVAKNRVTENGSGVALGDVDGDGWCDIYFCGLEGDNVLYRNLGNWKFTDVTREIGLAFEKELATGAVFADVDGDGDLDLLVNSIGGGTRQFQNDGKGNFTEVSEGRLVRRFGSMSMALGDIDRDGDLDLYAANYRTILAKDEFPRVKVEARMRNGEVVITPPGRFTWLQAPGGNVEVFELPERDFLYVNNGGRFAPVSWTNGTFLNEAGQPLASAPLDWGLHVMMRDINDDGLTDILVCNDFFNSPDRIWIQEPGLTFRAISLNALRKVSLSSMAVDVADINRDGLDDLFFVEMLSRDFGFRQSHRNNLMKGVFNQRVKDPLHRWEIARNTLFLNMGDGTYAEVAEMAGLDASEWSWGVVFMDVDLDGWEDLLVPTGHNHDVQNDDVLKRLAGPKGPDSYEIRESDLRQFPRLATPIMAFRNEIGRGELRFTEQQEQWGLNLPGVANGLACADLDNDGDLDLVANRLNDGALLLRNEAKASRVAIRLAGNAPNTRGVGAKILVRGGFEGVVQKQEMIAGGRYLSNDDFIRTFACKAGAAVEVEVRWTDGTRTVFSGLKPDAVYEIAQQGAVPFTRAESQPAPLFKDVSAMLGHRNLDPPFDDFQRQPLLPYSLATQGPALAWGDIDGDGREDLVIGAARGGKAAIYRNKRTSFEPVTNRFTSRINSEDQMGVLVLRRGTTEPLVAHANSSYEAGRKNASLVELSDGTIIPGEMDSPGSLALADVDSDGDLDLFVAGRILPGRFPVAASSRIYLNDGGKYGLSADYTRAFEKIGLVASAQFSDFNNDGRPDLLVALEWGAVRIYVNNGNRFVHESRGLDGKLGWWTSAVTGDFNNDGLTDIVAGNWGRNTKYERFVTKPLRLVHGDLDGNGHYDLFEAIFNPQIGKYVPMQGPEVMAQYFPTATEKIFSYETFARMSLEEMLGAEKGEVLEINTMDSMLFLNRGSTFEAQPLPAEVQFAPVFGMAVSDFDNDGNEDLVLGQNLFETRWETGKLDSGRPLFLRGDGKGKLQVIRSQESGLAAEGQQRAVAVSDFNRDGRVDVAMSQNNGETKLFQNVGSNAGATIRFVGPENNPDAVGVRYRIDSGPTREVHAGGGWLSQNSAVHVIPRSTGATRVQIRWPGGRKAEYELAAGAAEYVVSENGVKAVQ